MDPLLFMFHVCLYSAILSVPCSLMVGHLLGKGWPLGSLVCDFSLCFVTFLYVVSGQMWYLIVLIHNICLLLYF